MACGVMLGTAAFWLSTDYVDKIRNEVLLLRVVREVGEAYIDEVPRSELVDNAIQGIVAGLDQHSSYLTDDELALMEEDTVGHFGGIGIELDLVDGYFTVVEPLDGGPASRAGILPGDRLVEVDHEPLKGRSWTETINYLRGEPGTDVHVRIRRDLDGAFDFDLTRDKITVPSARGEALTDGVGYVRVSQFNDTTADDLADAVADLQKEGSLAGLIVDLRNNGGGLLTAAVDVADAFLAEGVIVSTSGRLPDIDRSYEASPGDLLEGAPLAVLINGGSASASEIVAAALKDHGRATLLGTKSYGKGSVQSMMYFRDTRAIKLTTARYLTPAGRSLHADGVTPDLEVARRDDENARAYEVRLLATASVVLIEA